MSKIDVDELVKELGVEFQYAFKEAAEPLYSEISEAYRAGQLCCMLMSKMDNKYATIEVCCDIHKRWYTADVLAEIQAELRKEALLKFLRGLPVAMFGQEGGDDE